MGLAAWAQDAELGELLALLRCDYGVYQGGYVEEYGYYQNYCKSPIQPALISFRDLLFYQVEAFLEMDGKSILFRKGLAAPASYSGQY